MYCSMHLMKMSDCRAKMKEKCYVGVIGAGQMGSGIAQVFAIGGYCVLVYDINSDALKLSQNRILNSLEKMKSKKLIDEDICEIQKRISYCSCISAMKCCSIFVESAFEDFKIKEDIFSELSTILQRTSFVASNTSSYSITKLSKMVPWPEKFIGFHFMNPPPMMELLEIIKGLYTNQETFDFFWNLAKELKKIPIFSKNSPGFVLNRILISMLNEAMYVLYEGISSAEEIDTAMKLGAHHPMGPLMLADLIGLDTVLAILKTLQKELGEYKYVPCPLLENHVKHGRLGKKSGEGFYKYE